MMLGRELCLHDQLQCYPPSGVFHASHEYVQGVQERLEIAQGDADEPPLFKVGNLVLLENRRRRKGDNPKLQSKFVGPYEVTQCYNNYTYEIERQGHVSVQNECRLKLYQPCSEESGQAPGSREPSRWPNMKGATRKDPQRKKASQEEATTQEKIENLGRLKMKKV